MGASSRSAARSWPAPGIRFLLSGGLQPPTGAPRGEAYRQPPDLEDWLVLLEDYALRCLAPQGSREASARYDAIAAALRELGFQLTRQGVRRGTSEVDRLLTGLAGQVARAGRGALGGADARGDALRGLVLCDAELAAQRPDDALHRRAGPRRRHRPPRGAGDRRRRPHRAACARCSSPAAACAAPRRRRRPARGPAAPPPRTASRCPSGRPSRTGC